LLDYLDSKDPPPSIPDEKDLLTVRNNLEMAENCERDKPFAQIQVFFNLGLFLTKKIFFNSRINLKVFK